MKLRIDGEVYEFDQSSILNTEAIAVQRFTGLRFKEWLEAVRDMDVLAITALVWVMWKRAGRNVAIDDVVFDLTKIERVEADEEAGAPLESSSTVTV